MIAVTQNGSSSLLNVVSRVEEKYMKIKITIYVKKKNPGKGENIIIIVA